VAGEPKLVVSLFSGALGLDLGLEQAGFKVAVAVESNPFAAETIRLNRKDIHVIQKDIRKVTAKEILKAAGVGRSEIALVTGGPSCQSFSTAGGRESLGDPRGGLFREFLRLVRALQPRFFVLENVRGILSAAVRHRPLAKRGPGYPPLAPDERLGSALEVVLRSLRRTRYRVVFDLLNTADYGVPQVRHRVVFLGSRDGEDIALPSPTHSAANWVTLRAALKDLNEERPEFTNIPPGKANYLRFVPAGGNWKNLPPGLQRKALGRAFVSWGGRSGFCRRLNWDAPAPALTTRPDSKATMLCHPDQLRPLSVGEYAHLQQFPSNWKFDGGTPQKYKMIGNAVPVGLGLVIGRALLATSEAPRAALLKERTVECAPGLAARLRARPHTVLNPQRMRPKTHRSLSEARQWMAESRGNAVRGGPVLATKKKRSRNTAVSSGRLTSRHALPASVRNARTTPSSGRRRVSTGSSRFSRKRS